MNIINFKDFYTAFYSRPRDLYLHSWSSCNTFLCIKLIMHMFYFLSAISCGRSPLQKVLLNAKRALQCSYKGKCSFFHLPFPISAVSHFPFLRSCFYQFRFLVVFARKPCVSAQTLLPASDTVSTEAQSGHPISIFHFLFSILLSGALIRTFTKS